MSRNKNKNKKYSTSWGLILSVIFHLALIALIGFWGIKRHSQPTVNEPISVSLSNIDYSGSSEQFSSKPTVASKEKVEPQKEVPKEEPEVKKATPEPKKVEKKEPPKPVFKQEPKKVVKKEEKKTEVKKETKKDVIPIETKKVEKKREVVKKPKPKKKKEKKVVKRPRQTSSNSESARNSVINDLKRKNILASIKKDRPSAGTDGRFGGEKGGVKGTSSTDKAGTSRINPVLLESYKQVIWKRIKPRFRIPPNMPKDGSLTADIAFDIDYSGKVSNVRVKQTSGNRAFDNFCINTIISSSPLPPPPSDIAKQVVTQGFQLPMANEG